MHKILFPGIMVILLSLLAGCKKTTVTDTPVACDPNISYVNTIKPMLAVDCNTSGCHDDIVITSLDNYQTLHDGALQVKNSILSGRMPKNKTLSAADKNAIVCWIDSGTKNN
jgi:hypothetical protein